MPPPRFRGWRALLCSQLNRNDESLYQRVGSSCLPSPSWPALRPCMDNAEPGSRRALRSHAARTPRRVWCAECEHALCPAQRLPSFRRHSQNMPSRGPGAAHTRLRACGSDHISPRVQWREPHGPGDHTYNERPPDAAAPGLPGRRRIDCRIGAAWWRPCRQRVRGWPLQPDGMHERHRQFMG